MSQAIKLEGAYAEAVVFSKAIEESAIKQIQNLLNQETFKGQKIRIMPDVHGGAGCVIGFTSTVSDRVIPNLIGVDIGCGVLALKTNLKTIDFAGLDQFIRENIPFGFNKHKTEEHVPEFTSGFITEVVQVCAETGQHYEDVIKSVGTLGGGNHFIEVSKGEDAYLWVVIHTGSRNFGYKIAEFHQAKAIKLCGDMQGLEYLTGEDAMLYYRHMVVAQMYASQNRWTIVTTLRRYLPDLRIIDSCLSVHNYLSFTDYNKPELIRKGAISANKGEPVIIPLNMRDGSIIGTGKGNPDWNYSAPHGAGRLMSRKQAKKELSLNKFKTEMQNVWSSCVSENTLDESPMAYKDPTDMMSFLDETITITEHIYPVYNFKADEGRKHKKYSN